MNNRYLSIPFLITLGFTCALLSPAPSFAADKPTPVGKADADQLITDAQEALALVVKTARADKGLDPTKPENKPFYSSLKRIDRALTKAKTDLAAKDPKFVHNITAARAGVAEMNDTWDLTKSKNKDVIAAGKELDGAVVALEENYNPLAERKAKGGELSPEEKADFDKLKAKELGLVKKLEKLEAENKSDKALEKGLKDVQVEAHHIAKSPETVAAYADALEKLAQLAGELRAYEYYMTPAERKKWSDISYYTTSFDNGYAIYEPAYTYDWSYTSTEVSTYDSYSSLSSEVTTSDVTSEDSYLEDTSFKMDEKEEEEVADETDSESEDEADDNEMESEQEEADDQEDDSEMDDSADSDTDSDDGADDSEDSSDEGGDDDDGGGDDGGGDE